MRAVNFPGDPYPIHIDATFTPLRPGLILNNPNRRLPDDQREYFHRNGWEIMDAAQPAHNAPPPLCYSSVWLSMKNSKKPAGCFFTRFEKISANRDLHVATSRLAQCVAKGVFFRLICLEFFVFLVAGFDHLPEFFVKVFQHLIPIPAEGSVCEILPILVLWIFDQKLLQIG